MRKVKVGEVIYSRSWSSDVGVRIQTCMCGIKYTGFSSGEKNDIESSSVPNLDFSIQ